MKNSYWLIIVFLVWCLGAALWYMMGVKQVSTDPGQFSASANLLAIAEILIMILGAFFIGFGLAWTLRGESIQEATQKWVDAEYKIHALAQELDAIRQDKDEVSRKFAQVEESIRSSIQDKTRYRELAEKNERQAQLWHKESQEQEAKAQQLESELTSIRFRLRLLENEVAEKGKEITLLKSEREQIVNAPPAHRNWSDHPFVRPIPTEEEPDDLTLIKGIGPKFMQKLNALDIFSFRQLSELSGEDVERLAEVIEVFPDRIHRDNWIGQATKLYLKKLSNA